MAQWDKMAQLGLGSMDAISFYGKLFRATQWRCNVAPVERSEPGEVDVMEQSPLGRHSPRTCRPRRAQNKNERPQALIRENTDETLPTPGCRALLGHCHQRLVKTTAWLIMLWDALRAQPHRVRSTPEGCGFHATTGTALRRTGFSLLHHHRPMLGLEASRFNIKRYGHHHAGKGHHQHARGARVLFSLGQ